MKAKRIITLALAVILAAMTVVSVSAAQLTETNPNGKTEVIAHINGAEPGDVTYILEIPDVVDFEELTIPADTSSDYDVDREYYVRAKEINGLDPNTQQISVYVKDQNATVNGDQEFYIANKDNPAIKFTYDVYSAVGASIDGSSKVNKDNMFTNGYFLTSFDTEGESLLGTLRFHQKQLYGQNIAEIAGDYSGYMVFFSAIENI